MGWHRFDLEPTFYFDADPDPDLTASFTYAGKSKFVVSFTATPVFFHVNVIVSKLSVFWAASSNFLDKIIAYFYLVEIDTDPDPAK